MHNTPDHVRLNVGTGTIDIDLAGCDFWPLLGQVTPRDVELDEPESRYLLPGVEFESDGSPVPYRVLLRSRDGRYIVVGQIMTPADPDELPTRTALHAQVSRRTARRLLLKSRFSHDRADWIKLPAGLDELDGSFDPGPDDVPVRAMTPASEAGNGRAWIDLDEDGFREVARQLDLVIAGLDRARIRAIKRGWGHVGGNAGIYPECFAPMYPLLATLGLEDLDHILERDFYVGCHGANLTRFIEARGLPIGEVNAVIADIVCPLLGLEREYRGERGASGLWPEVTPDLIADLKDTRDTLGSLLAVGRDQLEADGTAMLIAVTSPDENQPSMEATEAVPAAVPTRVLYEPSKREMEAWRLHHGGWTQKQIAEKFSEDYGRPYEQYQICRLIARARKALGIEKPGAKRTRPKTIYMDPDKLHKRA